VATAAFVSVFAGYVDGFFARRTILIHRNGSDLAVFDCDGAVKDRFRRDDLPAFQHEINFVRHFASFLTLF
jgi:hypothetical protein